MQDECTSESACGGRVIHTHTYTPITSPLPIPPLPTQHHYGYTLSSHSAVCKWDEFKCAMKEKRGGGLEESQGTVIVASLTKTQQPYRMGRATAGGEGGCGSS